MIIFVYGEDTYRSRRKLHELVDAFRKKHDPSGLNIAKIDGAKATANEIGAAVNAPGFLAARRMVVVSGLLASKRGNDELTEQFIPLLQHHLDSTVIILRDDLSEASVKAHPIRKSVGKNPKEVVDYSFAKLEGRELLSWIGAEARARAAAIEPKAIDELAATVGNDLWRLSSELEKLAARAGGQPILARDVAELVRGTVEENIFAVIDAIAERNAGRASALLRDQLAAGLEEMYVISMLIRQFRLLLMVHSFLEEHKNAARTTLASSLKLHPFVAGKLVAQARSFSREDVTASFEKLFAIDRGIKTGRFTPGVAIDLFLGSLAH